MELINFLVFLFKVFGLVFVIGLIIDLILDVVIIQPIHNRTLHRKRLELLDVIIDKVKKGEDISNLVIDEGLIKLETEGKIED